MNDPTDSEAATSNASADELIRYALHQAKCSDLVDLPLTVFELPSDSFPGYALEDEIHRGGQGVVYRAMHHATRRRVAIKVIRLAPLAGANEKARFEREVQVLGRLKHANIVALHDGGVSNGLGFLVTDYIEGVPLDEYVRAADRSTEELLRLFVNVCQAVSAAHVRGIVHRDLKPGNIRVDEQGEPHILDFGLAKLSAPESDAIEGVTITGQFVGSLPWAAPEQAEGAGDRIDIRTDVYALGMILFHLLTRRFPYEITGTMREVVERIVNTKPARPSTFRPGISDDLDTITLKCLSKEPERRYQSSGELARDVERYLAGEPIEAKGDSTWYVLTKTVRRHSTIAVASILIVVLTLLYAGTMTVLYRRALSAESEAKVHAKDARNKFRLAQDALEFLVGEVSKRLSTSAGGSEERRVILEGAFTRLEALTKEHGDDPALEEDLARTHGELGDIALTLGHLDKAEVELRAALAIRERLAAEEPENRERHDALSWNLIRLGDALKAMGKTAAVGDFYRRAFEIDRRLASREPANAHLLDNLSWSYERLGWLAEQDNDLSQAQSYAIERVAIAERLVAMEPDSPLRLLALLGAYGQLGVVAGERGDWETALTHAEKNAALVERVVSMEPGNTFYKRRLVAAQGYAADFLEVFGRIDEAKERRLRAIAVGEELLREDPDVVDNVSLLPPRYGQLAAHARLDGDFEAMAKYVRRGHELAERYVALAPDDSVAWHFLFGAYHGLAEVAHVEGREEGARRYIEEAFALAEKVKDTPRASANLMHSYAELLIETQVLALRDTAMAVEVAKKAVLVTGGQKPQMLLCLGKAYLANGEVEEAHLTLNQAVALLPVGDSPLRKDFEGTLQACTAAMALEKR